MDAKDLKGVFILLVFATVCALAFNTLNPKGIRLVGEWEAAVPAADTEGAGESLSPDKVKEIIGAGTRIVIDVRSSEAYQNGHIPGAINFPIMAFDENVEKMFEQVPPQSPVLVYCSSFQCTDSKTFAQMIQGIGYSDVMVFAGGFRQWEASGFEIQQ